MDLISALETDLLYLQKDDIIKIISNTFTSKVIVDDKNYTIIECEWHLLDSNTLLKRMYEEISGKKYKVYLYLFHNDYNILRAETEKILFEVIDKYKKLSSDLIVENKYDFKNDNHYSAILKGRKFYNIWFSLIDMPFKFVQYGGVTKNNKNYTINSVCGFDIDHRNIGEDSSLAYFSDLIIGSHMKLFGKDNEIYI